MLTVVEAIEKYRRQPSPPEASISNPFKLRSTIHDPAPSKEVYEAWSGLSLAADAADLWAACREARLFEDVDYGQWGLALLSPFASAMRTRQECSARPADFKLDDIVLGEFLGDQDLLVIAPSESGQRKVLIALPLDSRRDWFGAAPDLGEFLARYFDRSGDKYWERPDS